MHVPVSTTGQDVRSQEPDLRASAKGQGSGGRAVWYRDTFTGSTLERHCMSRLKAEIKTGRLRTFVVWRLDRLGRTAGETTNPRG